MYRIKFHVMHSHAIKKIQNLSRTQPSFEIQMMLMAAVIFECQLSALNSSFQNKSRNLSINKFLVQIRA
jgi:hypothetical protein